jgi:hypothetical protein
VILRYILSKEGKLLDPKKISTIVNTPPPNVPKTSKFPTIWPNFIIISLEILLSSWPQLNEAIKEG